MQTFTHDRYADQPPHAWIGRHWISTAKDGSGEYLRGVIIDIRPGGVRVKWPSSTEWAATDKGSLARG
ncbi:hypothetical protein ABH940_003293 [Streptacidiphilus sp. BW17]|uniref:hypothetical protein n=1 Tax=unclassified Streptacidiphilus TaxID=2643834 RepID=UPI0035149071